MKIRIKPFVINSLNWAKGSLLTFVLIYSAIIVALMVFMYNLIVARGAGDASFSMNYYGTFMIFVFINGIVMGASKQVYDVWLSLGMTRKEIIIGFAVQFAIMSGLVVVTHLIMTYGFALLQSALFKISVSEITQSESMLRLGSINPITFVFASFFMAFSTTAIGFNIGIFFSRWKKVALGALIVFVALVFISTTNLVSDPMGTLKLMRQIFEPLEKFIVYYAGDNNAITMGVHNLVISLGALALGYVLTIKRIARIN